MPKEIIKKLSECLTPKDVKNLFKDVRLDNRTKSPFFSNPIIAASSPKRTSTIPIELSTNIELALRVFLYLKFEGYVGRKPQNSGEHNTVSGLHAFLKDISKVASIEYMSDIDGAVIDKYLENQMKKNIMHETIRRKIYLLSVFLDYGEYRIPSFLLPNPRMLSESRLYPKIDKAAREERNTYEASIEKAYPLDQLKIILADAINYIENYGKDALLASERISQSFEENHNKRYGGDFDFFKHSSFKFTEPVLATVQKEIEATKSKFIRGENGLFTPIPRLRIRMMEVVDRVEMACIAVALMMTGMRASELITLDRMLKISEDEHVHLERMIYKTAASEDGEPLEMPIPVVCKTALEILSQIATHKDKKEEGSLILTSLRKNGKQKRHEFDVATTGRVIDLLEQYSDILGVEKITSHQFRHAMAYLISRINEKDGLEVARMFLGHTSTTMTLHYMGHYNKEIREALKELNEDESRQMIDMVIDELSEGKKLYGGARKIFSGDYHEFTGEYAESYTSLLKRTVLQMVNEKKMLILQTPTNICIHDLSSPEKHACQRGFDLAEIAENGVMPSRCSGASCQSSLFLEGHVEKLKDELYQDVDAELRERLEKNSVFMSEGGFDQDPYKRLIGQYDKDQSKKKGVA